MNTEQYLRALKKLGLTKAGIETQKALGLSPRQLQYIAYGECPVPETLAKLLACLIAARKAKPPA